jgi:hypothetical protein
MKTLNVPLEEVHIHVVLALVKGGIFFCGSTFKFQIWSASLA